MFLDTFAWLEYFMGSAKGNRVRERIEDAPIIYTCPMVLAEVASKLERAINETEAADRTAFIVEHAVMIEHTAGIGILAGRIHAMMKEQVAGFGMADAFILAAARSKGVRVLTGDPHFKGVEDADLL